jgi:DNA-binding CsgD family transcriptional regulator
VTDKTKRLLYKSIFGVFQQKSLFNVVRRELVLNFGYDNKLAIADVLAQRMLELFEEYAPDREKVQPQQVIWLAVDASDPPGYGKTLADTRQRSVILDLWAKEEIEELANGARPKALLPQRVARLCQQAFQQGGLLTVTDLSLILGISGSTVRHAMQVWEEAHQQLLPTRSTIHDLGSTISHKRQIVALHLQGYFTSEIARMTNHDPHNVDRYLRDFERVYDMARDGAPLNKICFLTGLSPRLVKEYLRIIKEHDLIPAPDLVGATSLSGGGKAHAST